jgi:penicillin-insensitive murein endopeptidase
MRVLSWILNATLTLPIALGALAICGGANSQDLRSTSAIPVAKPVKTNEAGSAVTPEKPGDKAPAALPATPANEAAQQSAFGQAPRPAALPRALSPAQPALSASIIDKTPAKDLFGAMKEPADLASKAIGFYARGCLAGAQPLPINGPAWQAMRLSRNRNWGHPTLVKFLERFAVDVKEKDGWPGLLVGDMSMPRGGPMPYGHVSHQVGLDVDIWYKPMPDHVLSSEEREQIPMESFLSDRGRLNPAMWTAEYEKLLRRAVSYPEVARIFVDPAIKKWLCDNAKGDHKFLGKITPIGGHDDHFHVRLVCPFDDPGCQNQTLPGGDDEGCGNGLDKLFKKIVKPVVKAAKPAAPLKSKRSILMTQLPAECKTVLQAAPQAAAPVTAAK